MTPDERKKRIDKIRTWYNCDFDNKESADVQFLLSEIDQRDEALRKIRLEIFACKTNPHCRPEGGISEALYQALGDE